MVRLMRAFTKGKTEILEDDALTLVQWAMAQRMGAMVLDGDLTPIGEFALKENVVGSVLRVKRGCDYMELLLEGEHFEVTLHQDGQALRWQRILARHGVYHLSVGTSVSPSI